MTIDRVSGPALFDFGNGPVPAHQHVNGGGWVADTVEIEDTVFVGPNARVFGKAVAFGYARISSNAQVFGKAWVYGSACISGNAWVYDDAKVHGEARICGDALIGGNAEIFEGFVNGYSIIIN